jgi:hypothetical protein
MLMTLFDRVLAAVGALGAVAQRLVGGSRTGARVLVVVLLLVSIVPSLWIGSSKRPTDLSFDDVRYQRIPAMTSWFRMQGDLRSADNPVQPLLYELVDPADGTTFVNVLAPFELPPGPITLTGSLSATGPGPGGYVGWFDADAVAEPRQDDRFWLILVPGIVGLLILLGLHLGYPVVRPERPRAARATSDGTVRPAPSDGVPAAWAGWIRAESIPTSDPRPCVVTVTSGSDVAQLTIRDGTDDRQIPVRRGGAARRIRLWYLRRSQAALDVRGAGGDIYLVFDDPISRDRVGAALG